MRRLIGTVMALVALVGLLAAPASAKSPTHEGDCVKFDSDVIGNGTVSQSIAGVTVTITEWIEKSGENGEYMGFTYDATGNVAFHVKAGSNYSPINEFPEKHAISQIVFCVEGDVDGIDDEPWVDG